MTEPTNKPVTTTDIQPESTAAIAAKAVAGGVVCGASIALAPFGVAVVAAPLSCGYTGHQIGKLIR